MTHLVTSEFRVIDAMQSFEQAFDPTVLPEESPQGRCAVSVYILNRLNQCHCDRFPAAWCVVRTMVRSLIRIRQNRDELVPYIANRWKMDTEFAASSYDTMLKAYSPNGSTSTQSIQSVIDSIKSRNPAVGVSNVVSFVALEEVQREMKLK